MSLDCVLVAISSDEAEAVRTGKVQVGDELAPPRLAPLWNVSLFLSLGGLALLLAYHVPNLKWLWFATAALVLASKDLVWRRIVRRGTTSLPPVVRRAELVLEKSWDGLHFLLNGTNAGGREPLCHLVWGGKEVGLVAGGPVRLLNSAQVRQFQEALSDITPAELRRRFNPESMKEVYPNTWHDPGAIDWLVGEFHELRAFVAGATERGDALLISLG